MQTKKKNDQTTHQTIPAHKYTQILIKCQYVREMLRDDVREVEMERNKGTQLAKIVREKQTKKNRTKQNITYNFIL